MAKHQVKPVALIVDQFELRRAVWSAYLAPWARTAGLELLARAPSQAAVPSAPGKLVKLIILNVGAGNIGERSTLEMIAAFRDASCCAPFLIVSDREEREQLRVALDAGAHGFLPTSMLPQLALEALSFILHGGSYFPPPLLRRAVPGPTEQSRTASGRLESGGSSGGEIRRMERTRESALLAAEPQRLPACPMLTERQNAVLKCLRRGYSNKVIARELDVAEATIKVHVRQIMRKLGASNRTQAAISTEALHSP
jgi:DNA-binding NarL/FixJ family response regulator